MTYKEKLKKWQEEKELKKQLEARKKAPVFKVCHVNPGRVPSSVHTATALKNKGPLKFVPRPMQPSRVPSKPLVTSRDVPKSVGKITPRPAPAVSAGSRSIPSLKGNLSSVPTTKNNSRQLPASNTGTKLAVLSSRTQTNLQKNSSAASGLASRIVKPSSNINTPKQTPETRSVSTTAATSKIPNQRTGIASRIVPPRSCNKQGTTATKTNASVDKNIKNPQKKLPAPKGTKVDTEKQIKSSRKEEEFEDSFLLDSICEEKSCADKKRATKSFAPDDFKFSFRDKYANFALPFGNPRLVEMYADMCGIPPPWDTAKNKSSSKSRCEERKEESKAGECKVEVPLSESPKLTKEDKNVTEDEPSVSQPKLKDSPIKLEKAVEDSPIEKAAEDSPIKLEKAAKDSPIKLEKGAEDSPIKLEKATVGIEGDSQEERRENITEERKEKTTEERKEKTTEERREKLKDVPLFRPLRTISENSPLPNSLELDCGLSVGLDDDCSSETANKPRRSRRLASNLFSSNSFLDPKYFQKTKPTSTAASDLCSLPENPVDSPLASALSELSVDSPDTKQYHLRVHGCQRENRISLLGSPVRPHTGPRKSIKGDLICFTP